MFLIKNRLSTPWTKVFRITLGNGDWDTGTLGDNGCTWLLRYNMNHWSITFRDDMGKFFLKYGENFYFRRGIDTRYVVHVDFLISSCDILCYFYRFHFQVFGCCWCRSCNIWESNINHMMSTQIFSAIEIFWLRYHNFTSVSRSLNMDFQVSMKPCTVN